MSQPPSATLNVARSRANTGASVQAASSYRSTNGSSVVSNGSLLDLYARSPGSFPDSVDSPIHVAEGSGSTAIPHPVSVTSSTGIPLTPTARGFQAPGRDQTLAAEGFSILPSDSNASIWTTASATATDSLPQSKRASMIGFDVDAMRSIQPANANHQSHSAASDNFLTPRIGVEAPQDDSDGSHYDDEEMPGAFSHDSFDRSADRTIEPHSSRDADNERHLHRLVTDAAEHDDEVFSNALPSPPVPRRVSSVTNDTTTISPSTSLMEDLARADLVRHAHSRSGSGQLSGSSIPQRRSSTTSVTKHFADTSQEKHQSLPRRHRLAAHQSPPLKAAPALPIVALLARRKEPLCSP